MTVLRALGLVLALSALPGAALAQSGNLSAELLTRLAAQEEALRRLTAQIEQLQFDQRNRLRELQAQIEDLEFRIMELEGGDPFAAADPPSEAPVASPSVPPAGAVPEVPRLPDAAGEPPRALGTLRLAEREAGERDAFDAALARLEADGLDAGLEAFEAFRARFPASALGGDVAWWLGSAFYERGRFSEAARQYLSGVRDHGESPRTPQNLLGLGETLLRLGQRSEACASFAEIERRHPDASAAVLSGAREAAARAGCS